jgi:hypothetical protein
MLIGSMQPTCSHICCSHFVLLLLLLPSQPLQAFNVAAMLLVRSMGAVATGLTMSCLVPVTVAAFTLPLPLLQPAQLGPHFMAGGRAAQYTCSDLLL